MHDTPRVLYSSLADPALSHYDMHKRFLQTIRDMVWDKIQFEDELPPSMDALWRHWLRTCWVSHMWSQAADNHMIIPDVSDFGWMGHCSMIGNHTRTEWQSNREWASYSEGVHAAVLQHVAVEDVAV